MTDAKQVSAVSGLVLCLLLSSFALGAPEGDIAFRGKIPVPTTGDRLDLFITLITLVRQDDGTYTFESSKVQSQAMQLDPREPGLNNSFDFKLDPTADSYQFTIDVLGMSGIAGRYLFNYDDLRGGEYDQHTVSVTGKSRVPFEFRLAGNNEAKKANRLDMMKTKDGGFNFFLFHWTDTRLE